MSVQLYLGDCVEVMRTLDENSVDTCITDPPYELGFMGKKWDSSGVAFQLETWQAVYRVLKPGAIMLAFGGTRTYHRMVCAIEDAGFEIRDMVEWVYGSGFPKSYDISKGIDKQAGAQREVVGKRTGAVNPNGYKTDGIVQSGGAFAIGEFNITAPSTPEAQLWDGWGTALKPAMELICVAMKPIDGTFVNNALTYGVAGLWIDGGRVEYQGDADWDNTFRPSQNVDRNCWLQDGNRMPRRDVIQRSGRFPANLIHDGSDEVLEGFPETHPAGNKVPSPADKGIFGVGRTAFRDTYGDDGRSAARFFYCAKASRSERNAGLELNKQNHHPTVKPISLMRYLVRLTKTPTGGVVVFGFRVSLINWLVRIAPFRGCDSLHSNRAFYLALLHPLQPSVALASAGFRTVEEARGGSFTCFLL